MKIERIAGEEYLFEGPGTYIPRKEVEVVGPVRAHIIRPNEALRLRAVRETKDRDGNIRVAGEEWMIRKAGAYLPGAYEEIVKTEKATILTEKMAIEVRALKSFKDQLGKNRKNGEEYIITHDDMESHIPDVYEEVKGSSFKFNFKKITLKCFLLLGPVHITTLTSRQYCIILNPVGLDGKNQLGVAKLVKGEKSFFLQPGEELENGIQDVYVLGDDEGLVLRALEKYSDNTVEPVTLR